MSKLAVQELVRQVHSVYSETTVVQELVHSSQFMIFNPSLRRRLDLKHAQSYESLACIVEDRDDEPGEHSVQLLLPWLPWLLWLLHV